VTDQVKTPISQSVRKPPNIRQEMLNSIVADIIRSGPARIAALVDRHSVEAQFCSRNHYRLPSISKLGKAMQEQDELPAHWTTRKSLKSQPVHSYFGRSEIIHPFISRSDKA